MKKMIWFLAMVTLSASASAMGSWPGSGVLLPETAEVEAFLATHEVRRVTNYCLSDQLNCRSVVQYKDKITGLPVESFEDRFMASTNTRAVSFRGFFLKQANGNFNIYSQDKLQNNVELDTADSFNQDVTITFDANDYPTIPVTFRVVGTDPIELIEDTLIYTTTEATFTNNTADVSDDFVVPFVSVTNH